MNLNGDVLPVLLWCMHPPIRKLVKFYFHRNAATGWYPIHMFYAYYLYVIVKYCWYAEYIRCPARRSAVKSGCRWVRNGRCVKMYIRRHRLIMLFLHSCDNAGFPSSHCWEEKSICCRGLFRRRNTRFRSYARFRRDLFFSYIAPVFYVIISSLEKYLCFLLSHFVLRKLSIKESVFWCDEC